MDFHFIFLRYEHNIKWKHQSNSYSHIDKYIREETCEYISDEEWAVLKKFYLTSIITQECFFSTGNLID